MKNYLPVKLKTAENKSAFRYEKESLILLREWSDNCTKEQAETILEEADAGVLFAVGNLSDTVIVRCLCRTDFTRALELVEYVLGQFGTAKGSARWAQGSISQVLLSVCMTEVEISDITEYFMECVDRYFAECEVIEAKLFSKQQPERVASMKEYEKARVSWAFVKTTEVAKKGETLSIRTLENDTGVLVDAAEDVYVMIGCRGEVYQIQRQKFESSYEPSDEKLDIFRQFLDFIPAVERVETAEYVPIDEFAHLCYPKRGAAILAQRLERRTRVFSQSGTDYFVGKQGDYIAMRKDDPEDVYIIQEEVFRRTYVEKES